jgi:hypothetical protein
MGAYGGFQQSFGNNFYPTATMPSYGFASTAAPVDGASPAATNFQFQQFPQNWQFNGGWGGHYGNRMGGYPLLGGR